MEKTIEVLERHCHENMNHAIETEEGLGIEYDEDVICDVCRSPDSEDGNDMVFCDKCNICVHQVSACRNVDILLWFMFTWANVAFERMLNAKWRTSRFSTYEGWCNTEVIFWTITITVD